LELAQSQEKDLAQWIAQLENILSDALALQLFEAKNQSWERVKEGARQRLESVVETTEVKTQPESEQKPKEDDALFQSDEIKVLPHPEGPPVNRREAASDLGKNAAMWELGLNDRISLTQHLFGGNNSDYSRVMSQLSTLTSKEEALAFIEQRVKPDYDWSEKAEFVERLTELVEARWSIR
jgi:hypothetical protein